MVYRPTTALPDVAAVTDQQSDMSDSETAIWEDRFALLEWLGDPNWTVNNPEKAADLRERGIPFDHYRSIWNVVLIFSSGENNGFPTPLPIGDLTPYLHGDTVFNRSGHELLKEVSWKFNVGPAILGPTWLRVVDHRGPCNNRVFHALNKEWSAAVHYFQGKAKAGLWKAGWQAITDAEYEFFNDPERFDHMVMTYNASAETPMYDIKINVTTGETYDDWEKLSGHYCTANLTLELK